MPIIILLPKGNTEREFLIIEEHWVNCQKCIATWQAKGFYHDPEVAKLALLNKVTFCSERIKVTVIQWILLQLELNNYDIVNIENSIVKYQNFTFFHLFSSILKISFQVISLQEILVQGRRTFV